MSVQQMGLLFVQPPYGWARQGPSAPYTPPFRPYICSDPWLLDVALLAQSTYIYTYMVYVFRMHSTLSRQDCGVLVAHADHVLVATQRPMTGRRHIMV